MVNTRSILVVDDDAAMCEMIVSMLEERGYRVESASSADQAVGRMRETDFDAVLSDIRMPGKTGIELLGEIRELRPDTPVVLMTAFGSIDSAVEAMRAGAFDYITKPFKRDEALVVLDRALERRALEEENRQLRRAVEESSSLGDLLGRSPAMRDIFSLVRKVANNQSNVLVTGESGTGKEVVARTIHFSGLRAKKPFIPINCTAIPEGLLESELFGHVRGAFTGANTSKRGLFEKAGGGSLFLDEIGDMGGTLQSKLLRVLQDGEVRPVGSTETVKVDVRIIAATNKDLRKEIAEGRFRQDLFYRLNVIPIHIPPLRERPEDVAVLAEAFVRKHNQGRPRALSHGALQRLMHCRWDGNARELENVIERTLALCDNEPVGADDLVLPEEEKEGLVPFARSLVSVALEKQMSLRELEDLYTEEVLKSVGGNKVQAARILGINRRTLYRRGERAQARETREEREAAGTH
jgi:DNA-binding NtrC family response regulator